MSEIVIYTAKDGHIELDVNLANETVWLTINQMTKLFGRDKSVISRHLSNIFKINELDKTSVVANFATTASDGKTYQVDYYNLDAIISVGYRVNSKEGVQFRKWASNVLKEHL
ncbi:TPA: virulence RhuM family protein, partial [Legionella pneumophila]|nr:virulence RhuM family protein [Legionella pneumophila]